MRVRTDAAAGTAVTLDGRASLAAGPWKSNVTGWQWQQVDSSDNVLATPTVTLTGANTRTPSFTAPSSAGDVHLRLTVTGRGEGVSGGMAVHYLASDTVTVTVQAATNAATDAELAELSLVAPDGSLVPLRDAGSLAETAFAAVTASYKAVLPAGAGQVTVAAVPRGVGASAAITPADADAGNGHQVAVAAGADAVYRGDGHRGGRRHGEDLDRRGAGTARRWLYAIGRRRYGTRSWRCFPV